MIDLEELEAHLDLALTDELRAELGTAAAVVPAMSPPAPVPAPAPAVPRREQAAPTEIRSRPRSSAPPFRPEGRSAPAVSPLAPANGVWEELDIEQHARLVVDLLSRGRLPEADLHIAAHADLASAGANLDHRGDAIAWSVMQALLAGRHDAARTGLEALAALGPSGPLSGVTGPSGPLSGVTGPDGVPRIDKPADADRYWVQRLRVAIAWGDEGERYELLDHCRTRAWCHGDVAWQGRLTLLLAHLGRTDEARREFDATVGQVPRPSGSRARALDADGLDLATDLAEAAAHLGDHRRHALVLPALASAPTPWALTGRAWIAKGPVAHFQAMVTTAPNEVTARAS